MPKVSYFKTEEVEELPTNVRITKTRKQNGKQDLKRVKTKNKRKNASS